MDIALCQLFPALFSLMCCLVFGVPVAVIANIGRMQQLAEVLPLWLGALAIIPAVVVAAHAAHSARPGAPSKLVVFLALTVPSMVLLCYGGVVYLQASRLSEELSPSVACAASLEKRRLQHAWDAARDMYDGCMEATGRRDDIDPAALRRRFRLQDCEEYAEASRGSGARLAEWAYLRYMEETQGCSGWCSPAEPLWGHGGMGDSCSAAASSALRLQAMPRAAEVCSTMLLVLLISLALAFGLR